MSTSYNYNPIPPRVWSRVQNQCTFIIPNNSYDSVYIPLTNQTVSLAQANYEDKLISKGNVLQYKGNSSRLTKSQKYTQIVKGFGPNRTKSFATQSQTYTNPNTSGLLRVNYNSIPYPNQIVGAPNNISGPFQYNVPNPFDCSSNYLQDGGNLVCGTYANPCSGEIIKTGATSATICNPASASNVPGTSILCWNKKVQTWFPKPRYFMNNSTDKWPVNYKGFVSAVSPDAPVLVILSQTDTTFTLSWEVINSNCIPISNFNIYQNGLLIQTVPSNITTITINKLCAIRTYYVTSVSTTIESSPSNSVEDGLQLNTPIISIDSYISTLPIGVVLTLSPGITGCTTNVYSYNLYVSNGSTTNIIIVPGIGNNPQNYTLNLVYGYLYSIYITYVTDIGIESTPSNTVIVDTKIYTPTGFTATGTSPTTGILNWTVLNSYFVTSYDISGSTTANVNTNSLLLSSLTPTIINTYYLVANYNGNQSSQVTTTLTTQQYINIGSVQPGYSYLTNISPTSGAGTYYYMFAAGGGIGAPGPAYSNPSSIPNLGILYGFTVNYDLSLNYYITSGGGSGHRGTSNYGGGGGGATLIGTSLNLFETNTTYTISVGGFGGNGSGQDQNGGASSIGVGTNGTDITPSPSQFYIYRVTGGGFGGSSRGSGGGPVTIIDETPVNNYNGGDGGAVNSPGNIGQILTSPFPITVSGSTTTSNLYLGGGGGGGSTGGTTQTGYCGHGYRGETNGADNASATAAIGYRNPFLSYTGLFFGGGGGGGPNGGNGSTGVVIIYWTQ